MRPPLHRFLSLHACALLGLVLSIGPERLAGQTDSPPPGKLLAPKGTKPEIDVPHITYTRIVLKNGLVVLFHEDHSAPTVTVDVWYHVGSKDDIPGKTGLAHMYEHMMFEGSANVAGGEFDRFVRSVGGNSNATTNEDRTDYYATVPSNMLESTLWFDADQMAFATSHLDSARFNHERDVVRGEYNLNFVTPPANRGMAREIAAEVIFAGTPYGHTSMGRPAELATATLQDLRDFFRRYTVPNNAVLSIAGDFKTADGRAMAEKYFGWIPRASAVTHPTMPAGPMAKEERVVLEDRNQSNAHLWIAWRGAATTNPDQLALKALAWIVSGGPTSRLQRALVDGRHLAAALPAGDNDHFDVEYSGVFQIAVQARPGASLTDIETVTDSVIADVRAHGVRQDELDRWVKSFAVQSVVQLQALRTRADDLAEGETYHRNPQALFDAVGEAQRLTPADLLRVARKYLVAGRMVMSIVPLGKLDLVSKPSEPYTNMTRR